ncbi:DUF4296 domain-containing protein [Mucilaginibacter terrae]|uniref:DUF4296 domain-containing protein n=1 Tax=Mucilaginibacter terrae TaxID=1955052 RepID=A0ABU3GQN6_9SPHI|nr:DUF4296 domain-containing protein [Mucilaginibacter terrae]MDT3402072.1 hypothetical protein [Mucilaginibacter terrae]
MRIYKVLFFLVPVILLAACKPGRPDGILSPKQMVPLLVDVHLVDGNLANVAQMPDSLFKYGFNQYDAVFKQHKTDSVQFKKSFAWYANEPDQLYEVYVKVTDILKAKSDSSLKVIAKADSLERVKQTKIMAAKAKKMADSVKKAEKRKNDSIAKTSKGKADLIRKKLKTDSVAKKQKTKVI